MTKKSDRAVTQEYVKQELEAIVDGEVVARMWPFAKGKARLVMFFCSKACCAFWIVSRKLMFAEFVEDGGEKEYKIKFGHERDFLEYTKKLLGKE